MCVSFCVYSDPLFNQFYGLEMSVAQTIIKFIRCLNGLTDSRRLTAEKSCDGRWR